MFDPGFLLLFIYKVILNDLNLKISDAWSHVVEEGGVLDGILS